MLCLSHLLALSLLLLLSVYACVRASAEDVSTCQASATSLSNPEIQPACRERGRELVTCSANHLPDYCVSICVHHNLNSTCVCEDGGPGVGEGRWCSMKGSTPGWTGQRGEILADPCLPCDTLLLDLPCHGFSTPSRCLPGFATRTVLAGTHRCLTWSQCAAERVFDSRDSQYPCPDHRQGPHCGYEPLQQEQHLKLSLTKYPGQEVMPGLRVYAGQEYRLRLVLAWDAWRHDPYMSTSDVRILATLTNTSLVAAPAHGVAANTTHIFCWWAVRVGGVGREEARLEVSYPNDHHYLTGPDGRRRRERREVRRFTYQVDVVEDECLPCTLVTHFTGVGVWHHRPASRLRLEGIYSGRRECDPNSYRPTFCWSLEHRPPGASPAPLPRDPSHCVPQDGSCLESLLFLELPPFHLHYGNYTFRLLTNLTTTDTLQCTGGVVSVGVSPLTVQVEGYSSRRHSRGLPLVLEASWEDPDLPPAASTDHLVATWTCTSTDPAPGHPCTTRPLAQDPRVTVQREGRLLTVARNTLRVGQTYTFILHVKDGSGQAVGREAGQARVVVEVVRDVVPNLRLHCLNQCRHTHRLLPHDRSVLWVECLSCRRVPVPVYYRWSITRRDLHPPQEIDWHQATEAGVSHGLELTRVEVKPGHLAYGAQYHVRVRGQYRPHTPLHYQYLANLTNPSIA